MTSIIIITAQCKHWLEDRGLLLEHWGGHGSTLYSTPSIMLYYPVEETSNWLWIQWRCIVLVWVLPQELLSVDRSPASEPGFLWFGVPQGSILGPILFILYTPNILPSKIAKRHGLEIQLYADDSQLYFGFRPLQDEVQKKDLTVRIENFLSDIRDWMRTIWATQRLLIFSSGMWVFHPVRLNFCALADEIFCLCIFIVSFSCLSPRRGALTPPH